MEKNIVSDFSKKKIFLKYEFFFYDYREFWLKFFNI